MLSERSMIPPTPYRVLDCTYGSNIQWPSSHPTRSRRIEKYSRFGTVKRANDEERDNDNGPKARARKAKRRIIVCVAK